MTATIKEAQADLAGIIHRLAPGEELVLTDNNTAVATLRAIPPDPLPGERPPPGLWKGKVIIVSDDDEHLKDFAEYML
jgi:antitoxin (DNA-binding transcriptional repressor) of toxin-antitoxin stability system